MPILYDDILLLILEHVDSQADRLRILLVCRHWYCLLFPKAYERVSVFQTQIYRLVCSTHRNPEIGASIRDLSVEWCQGSEKGGYDVAMFRDSILAASRSSEDCEKWECELARGSPDAWLAVLVLSLEAVTSLSLKCTSQLPYFISMLARAAAAGSREKPFVSKPVLQRLERVVAKTESRAIAFPAADFLTFFRLPAMRVFSATTLHEDCNWPSVPKPTPGTSGIKELRLGGSTGRCTGIEGMADCIASCANLEVFLYQTDRKVGGWENRHLNFHPRGFYTALFTQRHSLRVLRLNNWGEQYWRDGFDEFGFLSLFEFHQLRELQIPIRMLLQFGPDHRPTMSLPEVLPPSLEHLCLAYGCERDTDAVIQNLHSMVEQREARFPRLRELIVQPFALEGVPVARGSSVVTLEPLLWMKQAFAPLTMACDKLGIQFGFDNGQSLKIAS